MLSSANLVGYLRAEFAKASRWRICQFFLQLLVVIPLAISVVIPDSDGGSLYWLAIMSIVLLAVWWLVNSKYERCRSAANAARRAALLQNGLGMEFSTSEIQILRECFTVNESEAAAYEKADYYASNLSAGPARLAEMLEESALYSEYLQRISATVMFFILLVFVAFFLVIGFAISPYVNKETFYIVVRIFMAILVFVMSADLFGAYAAHKLASREIRDIRNRLMNADRAGYPMSDVLLAFTDYNSAIEAAPESVPFAYSYWQTDIDRRWNTYQADRATAREAK